MKLGAGALVRAWGRDMGFYRDGILLFTFKGRFVEARPLEQQFDYSVDQHNFRIVGAIEDFVAGSPLLAVVPRKFDVIRYQDFDYTVHRAHLAGADEDELVKLFVTGGIV